MRNGQLKPAYNIQISTNNQYWLLTACTRPPLTQHPYRHLTQHIKALTEAVLSPADAAMAVNRTISGWKTTITGM